MSLTRISRILIDPAARNAALTEKIVAALPDVPREILGAAGITAVPEPRTLLLTLNRGRWIKPFYDGGTEAWYIVCQTGCWFSCVYCYLRTYLEYPHLLTVYVNSAEMEKEVEELVRSRPGGCALYTGELADSLMLDDLTGFSELFVRMARNLPVRRFEVRTKTDNIARLLTLPPADTFYVTFSLNPPELAAYEAGAAPVARRIEAMAACHAAGHRVGFHLDPLIRTQGWKDKYDRLLQTVFDRIPVSGVGYVSYGTLRFKRDLTDMLRDKGILHRFPDLVNEFYPGDDGKLRYYKPLRIEMLRWVRERLIQYGLKDNAFISMEPPYVMNAVLNRNRAV